MHILWGRSVSLFFCKSKYCIFEKESILWGTFVKCWFPKYKVINLDLSFEEASKFIVSAGTINPK